MNRGPYESTTQRSMKWQEGGQRLVKAIRRDRTSREILRSAARDDGQGGLTCPGCGQSCTGFYAGKPGCVRCGIVEKR